MTKRLKRDTLKAVIETAIDRHNKMRKEMVNMKRLIALLLAAALALSLAACGGGNSETAKGKDELLKNATEVAFEDLPNSSNKARAEQEIGNVYLITQTISEIGENYCDLSPVQYISTDSYGRDSYNISRSTIIRVYLPTETLAELNFGDEITIVGEISDIIDVENNQQVATRDSMCYEMENAYITTVDEFISMNNDETNSTVTERD